MSLKTFLEILLMNTSKIISLLQTLILASLPLWTVNVSFAEETASTLDASKIDFRATTDKLDYAPNEVMNFTFTVNYGDQPLPPKPLKFKWIRSGDDGVNEEGENVITPSEPVVIKTKLGKAGFVRMRGFLLDLDGKKIPFKNGQHTHIFFEGSAGVQISKLRCANREPRDFDAFWNQQKALLAKVPMKFKMEKVSKDGSPFDAYAVTIDCVGRPATGYLTIPAGAKEKSLRVLLTYSGYGNHRQYPPKGASTEYIHFRVNAHGYELGKDDEYYKKFFESIKSNGQIYAFDPKQNENPLESYFYGMVMRVMRSVQFVKTLPQWDGKNIRVHGGSQGGLQAIWAAGLDSDVTDVFSEVTWCCDFNGESKGRLGGWRPKYVKGLDYYDAINHAKRIKGKTYIARAGLGDYGCPPSGLAALYNSMKCPKKIRWVQGSTHGFVPKNPQEWIIKHRYPEN